MNAALLGGVVEPHSMEGILKNVKVKYFTPVFWK